MGIAVPLKYAAWLELVLISLITPNASFLGHLCGILAGLLYVHGSVFVRNIGLFDTFHNIFSENPRVSNTRYTYSSGVSGTANNNNNSSTQSRNVSSSSSSSLNTNRSSSSSWYSMNNSHQTSIPIVGENNNEVEYVYIDDIDDDDMVDNNNDSGNIPNTTDEIRRRRLERFK